MWPLPLTLSYLSLGGFVGTIILRLQTRESTGLPKLFSIVTKNITHVSQVQSRQLHCHCYLSSRHGLNDPLAFCFARRESKFSVNHFVLLTRDQISRYNAIDMSVSPFECLERVLIKANIYRKTSRRTGDGSLSMVKFFVRRHIQWFWES